MKDIEWRIGAWEPRNVRIMAKFLNEGGSILNIGANNGIEAVVLGRAAGPKGKLYLFEPIEATYNILVKNMYLNHLDDRASVFKMGASNAYSTAYARVDNNNTGGGYVYTDPNFKPTTQGSNIVYELIVADRIDNVLPKDAVIELTLIDVQTLELDVLEGMLETIARSPNMTILCEWWPKEYLAKGQGAQMVRILRWLRDHKYRFFFQNQPGDNCNDIKFIEQTFEEVVSVTTTNKEIYYVPGHNDDILFVPAHIDPNKL